MSLDVEHNQENYKEVKKKMQNQTELDKEIGTAEPEKKETLEPKKVKIVKVTIRDTKKGKILNCESKHPDKEENINISSLAYLRDKKVITGGLWMTLDKDENIQKNSGLAIFMSRLGVKCAKELEGKEAETELDDNKWLCFRAY